MAIYSIWDPSIDLCTMILEKWKMKIVQQILSPLLLSPLLLGQSKADVMSNFKGVFSSVQALSFVQFSATPWTAVHEAFLSTTNPRSPLKPMSIESVMPSNHIILCRPLLLLPSIFRSIRVFSNESALRIRWPKYWSFSFNISPPNEHPGLWDSGILATIWSGLPWWLRWQRICIQCRSPKFDLWGRKSPGKGNGSPLQYFCLENSMDRGAWQDTVHGSQRVGHNWTNNTFTFQLKKI